MSKRCQKEIKKTRKLDLADFNVNIRKIEQKSMLSSVIGSSNVKRWNRLKTTLSCITDEEFVEILLNFAQKHLDSNINKEELKFNDKSSKKVELHHKKRDHKHKRKKSSTSRKKSHHVKDIIKDSELVNLEPIKAAEKSPLKIPSKIINEDIPPNIDINVNSENKRNSLIVNISNEILVPLELSGKLKFPLKKEKILLNKSGDLLITPIPIEPVSKIKIEPIIEKQESNEISNHKKITPELTNTKKDIFELSNKQKHFETPKLVVEIQKIEQIENIIEKQNLVEKQKIIENHRSTDIYKTIDKQIPSEKQKHTEKVKQKKADHDIRKAPELIIQDVSIEPTYIVKPKETNHVSIKIKLCTNCGTRHLQEQCPLLNPNHIIKDSVSQEEWIDKYKESYDMEKIEIENLKDLKNNETDVIQINKFSFSYISLPDRLCYEETNTAPGLGVFTKTDLEEFTQFGPLIGTVIKEVDVAEDCMMRDMFEINHENKHIYLNTENLEESNWLKFVRPAPGRDERNISLIARDNALYFITIKQICSGSELLYWQDDVVCGNKKKLEKTSCGGCNMTFSHPLYYRIHCSVFHDTRYSLTIRKYHCKICGAAVLGKENIMKHATELHNGQGAYQCQFCKKFFLRLNYLEMHRTYGCSANPHRSRPLCDFCGRKFCQPQKLKVHIKRMHSDLSEVLKEFQCKNCFKILGSRAALQRHFKEVHQKQIDGACACSRCGKLFQNKSNLKIHMLTHSGIKPFRCRESNCNAAFTTKQCLQFHYKKVHSFSGDMMPKIERSVDYTFEAYSGKEDQEHEMGELHKEHDLENLETEDDDGDNSMEDKNIDEPPALHSPLPIQTNETSNSNPSPPTLEAYAPNMKILSKGSKKWIGEQHLIKNEIYPIIHETRKTDIHLEEELQKESDFNTNKINHQYNRHESSNASMLVEAALDSVCSEPNVDVSTTPNCDALNLYTLSHDNLPDVAYNHSIDVGDSRDINLISPSVNDHISVTDEIGDELRHSQNIGIDYSSFQQEDFSPPSSSSRNNFVRDYINANSPHYESNKLSPVPSPPRYDFGQVVNADSDDSNNGMGAQNLSLHNTKDGIQLDLSIYKSHYNFDTSNFGLRKDMRLKFDESERKQVYILDVEKNYDEMDVDTNQGNLDNNELMDKDFDIQDTKHKDDLDLSIRSNLSDLRNQIDLDLRKNYELEPELRRNTYEGSVDDFRIKNYDLDSIEIRNNIERNKTYESLMEDFRTDRNFEPLVLNPSELQGLDMSARSYHNYSNLNRYHHLYSEVERPSVDLRLNYSTPPPAYSHADLLRVVSLDLTPPDRHSVDLSLRTHQIANSRLLSDNSRLLSDNSRLLSDHSLQTSTHRLALDQSRLLSADLGASRHDSRLISDMSSRILSDHTTNRILSNEQLPTNRLLNTEQRLMSDDVRLISDQPRLLSEQSRLLSDPPRLISEQSRLISDQPRLLDQSRLLGESRILPSVSANGSLSPVQYSSYAVSPSPYHPTALPPRSHVTSPNSTPYHHYSSYY